MPASSQEPTALWRIVGAVLGQTALLSALLFYFGWARTQATFGYFGIDLSLLDFSTTDYVLRSVNSAYHPLLVIGLVSLGATLAHRHLRAFDSPRRRWAARGRSGVGATGTALVAVAVLALIWNGFSRTVGGLLPDSSAVGYAWLPTALATGFALLAWRASLTAARSSQLPFGLVALAVVASFWAVSLFAVHDGRARAKAIERNLRSAPEAVLLVEDLVAIRGPGVDLNSLKLPDPDHPYGRYRWSYTGLRLLRHTDKNYFFLPVGWRHGRARVYEVPDDGRVRLELIAH